ncbi:MAG: MMPL family transporter, partial [Nocardioides sp.]
MSARPRSRNPLAGIPTRAARWSALHPWRAILAWLGLVVVAVGLAIAVPTQQPTDADYRIGESGRADAMVHEAGLESPTTENVLITAQGDGAIDHRAAESAATELRREMSRVDGVEQVSEPQWSPDGSALLMEIQLAKDHDEAAPLVAATKAAQRAHPDLVIREAGDITIDDSINARVADDLSSAEIFSLPVTLVLMLLAFGALIAAGIPVLLAATSVAATIGITAPLSFLIPAEPTVSSMIVLIGMAVGVDYSLFYLKREREERAKGRTTLDAVEIAAETSGHSILVSGGAVIASMAGLYVVGDATFNSLATGAILVVAIAVLGSITVLPALLAKLGRWVDRPRVPLLWRLNRRIGQGGLSRRLLGPVTRRPVVALVVSGVVVLLLALPALGMKIHSANLQTLPQDIPEVQTFTAMTEAFPSEGTTAEVVVRSTAADQKTVAAALGRLDAAATVTDDFVATGRNPVEVSEDGTTSVLQLAMPYDESDERVDRAIENLRSDLVPAALGDLGTEHAVGGGAAESLDYVNQQTDRLPIVIGVVLLLTLLMMALAFRSLPLALISTGLNLASVGVAFGVLTIVFQYGSFSGTLDFNPPGFVITWIPLFVMVVLVGLSMDYHV